MSLSPLLDIASQNERFRSLAAAARSAAELSAEAVAAHMSAGIRLPVRDWAYLMMTVSDNTATNVLIDLVGLDAVNATMRLGEISFITVAATRSRRRTPASH